MNTKAEILEAIQDYNNEHLQILKVKVRSLLNAKINNNYKNMAQLEIHYLM